MRAAMKKAIPACLLLCLLFAWPAAAFAGDAGTPADLQDEIAEQPAQTEPVYYRNNVYPVTDEEHSLLEQRMADIGVTYGIDSAIIFVETTDGERLSEYLKSVYNEGVKEGIYKKEGIVLGFARAERIWAIYTTEERVANLISAQDKDDLWAAYLLGKGPYDSSLKYLEALEAHLEAKDVQPIPEDSKLPRLVDEADLFTDEEERILLAQLDEVSERHECDVIIVTVNSIGQKGPMMYADDFFDYNGYGYGEDDDGILFLLSMEYRDQAYSTYGFAIPAFTDAGQDYIFDMMMTDLGNGDWFDAFMKYISLCDEFLTAARNGEPMDVSNLPMNPEDRKNMIIALCILGAIVLSICVLIALFFVRFLVRKTSAGGVTRYAIAHEYAVPNSLHFTRADEVFIDRKVSKSVRIRETSSGSSGGGGHSSGSSTHTSSSGRSHGGSSRKF